MASYVQQFLAWDSLPAMRISALPGTKARLGLILGVGGLRRGDWKVPRRGFENSCPAGKGDEHDTKGPVAGLQLVRRLGSFMRVSRKTCAGLSFPTRGQVPWLLEAEL